MKYVNLVGALHDTIDALLFEEWRKTMNEQIASINQILPNTPAGTDGFDDAGRKAHAVRLWIRAVRHKIVQSNDVVFRNVLPLIELPSYTFQREN